MKPVVPSPIIKLHHDDFQKKQIEVFVKREDLIHEEIMGNKWRKLKYNLKEAERLKKKRLVTFGGAFSNHIAATAAAAKAFGFESRGIIRGDELNEQSNRTLRTAAKNGMALEFVSREKFREWKMNYPHIRPDEYLLPEGGTNALALKGVAEIMDEIDIPFDMLVTPVGTGGTLAGLLLGLKGKAEVWGFSALKGTFMHDVIRQLCEEHQIIHRNFKLFTNYHFGGYGKMNKDLRDFMNNFQEEFDFFLDPVYTGKMFFGVWEHVRNNQIAPGSCLLILHTGGLQGIQEINGH